MSDSLERLQQKQEEIARRRYGIAKQEDLDFFDWVDRKDALSQEGRHAVLALDPEQQRRLSELAAFTLAGIESGERTVNGDGHAWMDRGAVTRENIEAVRNMVGIVLSDPEILGAALEAQQSGVVDG